MKLTKRHRQFIQLYKEKSGDLTAIANEMGVSPSRITAIKNHPNVKSVLNDLSIETMERIQASSAEALRILNEMLHDDGTPANVKANIAQDLLDRAGVCAPKTPAIQVNINTSISERARSLLAERLAGQVIDTTAETLPLEDSNTVEPQ